MSIEFVRMLALSVSVVAIAGASLRIAATVTKAADLRVLVAATLGCMAVILESLALGLVRLGENSVALTGAAVATYAVVRWRVPAAAGPPLRRQLLAGIRGLTRIDQIGLGAIGGAGAVAVVYLLYRPFTPFDGLLYHVAEPAIWLHNGRPGSAVATSDNPFQAYPKNIEVIFGWLLGLARSSEVITLVMFAFMGLAALGCVAGLARLGIDRRRGLLVAGALLLVPVGVRQLAGAATDVPALMWMVVAAALLVGATQDEVGLLPMGLIAVGLALGTKATAIPLMGAAVLTTAVSLRATLREHWRGIAVGGGLGLFLGAIWYIQDWAIFGSPLYPFYRFPSAGPLPTAFSSYDKSLLQTFSASVRANGLHGYFEWFGGGLIVVAGIIVALAASRWLAPSLRRWVLVAGVIGVGELVLWSAGPFTGNPGIPGTAWYAVNGLRYLLPGLPAVALPIALLLRSERTVIRRIADAIFGLALIANIWALKYWGIPYRPPIGYLVAGAAAGAAVGVVGRPSIEVIAKVARATVAKLRGVERPAAIGASMVAAGLVLTIPATGFLNRALVVHQPSETAGLEIAVVVGWLNNQPAWRHGNQPLGGGPLVESLEAGPTFSHRLFLIDQATPCSQIRADAAHDWLVLETTQEFTNYLSYASFNRTTCLAGVRPAFTGGGYAIYPPDP